MVFDFNTLLLIKEEERHHSIYMQIFRNTKDKRFKKMALDAVKHINILKQVSRLGFQ